MAFIVFIRSFDLGVMPLAIDQEVPDSIPGFVRIITGLLRIGCPRHFSTLCYLRLGPLHSADDRSGEATYCVHLPICGPQ